MSPTPPKHPSAIGCPLCDALVRVPSGAADGLCCWRCGTPLPALHDREALRGRLQAVLALLCTACICIVLLHTLPMVALDLQGQHSELTLVGASHQLWSESREALASALFITTVAAPALEVAAMMFAAIAILRGGERAQGRALRSALHLWQTMRDWNMTEVLVLGTAVALVKLGQLATLIIGPGLLALMAFMALRLAAQRLFSPGAAWTLVAPQVPTVAAR